MALVPDVGGESVRDQRLWGALDAMAEMAELELDRARMIARHRPMTYEEVKSASLVTAMVTKTLREMRETRGQDEMIDRLRSLSNDELTAFIGERMQALKLAR